MPRSPGSVTARSLGPLQDHPCPAPGREGDVPGTQGFRARTRCAQACPLDDLAEHDSHLVLRERCSKAPPHTSAERNPCVALPLALQEALGAELERLRIEVLAMVDRDDRGQY